MKNWYLIFLYFVGLIFILFSCKKEKNDAPSYVKFEPKRTINNRILLMLGKDYEDKKDILHYLQNEYALGKDDAKAEIITYSDMLTKNNQLRFNALLEKIEEISPTIFISLGLPEGVGRYLLQIAQNYPNISIITVLPMEEALLAEAASDIVVDFQIPNSSLHENTVFIMSDDEIMLLLTASVFAAEDINAHNKEIKIYPIEEYRQAFFTAQQVLGKHLFYEKYEIKPYLDSDTNLPSHKYLLIYKNLKETYGQTMKKNKTNEENDDESKNDIVNPDELEGGA